jgi:hypothetical protein
LIHREDIPDSFFLGPMGNLDIMETNRLLFKNSSMNPLIWDKLPLRTWPNPTPGWRDWYLKVANKEQTN